MDKIVISTFYQFRALQPIQVETIKMHLEQCAEANGIRGLVLLGDEGVNSTISGPPAGVELFKREVAAQFPQITFKDSVSSKHPFHVFKVKIKDEIVTLGKPELKPPAGENNHLSPQKWHEAMQDPETIVLDTRNDYEVEIGKFKKAIDFNTEEFNEFPEKLKASGIPKDKKVLIYCTGGIRCEKAILEMHTQGYKNVFQLEGGILNYLKELPDQDFDGECFVFDYRVAVDQKLQPTQNYRCCPHCGQPAKETITCTQCGREETVCTRCRKENVTTCSKNCAHHAAIGSGSRGIHLQELNKRHRI